MARRLGIESIREKLVLGRNPEERKVNSCGSQPARN
jgi:hypothetical protein